MSLNAMMVKYKCIETYRKRFWTETVRLISKDIILQLYTLFTGFSCILVVLTVDCTH